MVKAPEQISPPQPREPKPKVTGVPRRRRWLAPFLVAGLGLGGGGAAVAMSGGSEKASDKPGVSAPNRTKDKTGTTEPQTQKETKTDVELINERIEAFFALSDEDFTTWFNTVDEEGKNNKFSIHRTISGSDFDFPDWINHSNYLEDGEVNKIMYNNGQNIVEMQENLSILEFSTDTKFASLYGINLGGLELAPSSDSSLSVVFLGLKFQENLGNYRVVIPIVTDAHDSSEADLKFLDTFGEFLYVDQLAGKNDRIGPSGYQEELDISREEFRTKLKKSENKPLIVALSSVESGEYNPEEQIPGIDFLTPGFRAIFIDGLSQLVLGNNDVFEANLNQAALEGYVITPSNPDLPEIFTDKKLKSVKEYLKKASLAGNVVFLTGSTPFPTAEVK